MAYECVNRGATINFTLDCDYSYETSTIAAATGTVSIHLLVQKAFPNGDCTTAARGCVIRVVNTGNPKVTDQTISFAP
jgi:hypothetical protein